MLNRKVLNLVFKRQPSFKSLSLNKFELFRSINTERQISLTSKSKFYTFDTNFFIKSLQESGLSVNQAETLAYAILEVTQSNLDYVSKNLVTKEQQEIMLQQILSNISSIKKDMIILEKSEFSSLKHEYEKLSIELTQLKRQFKDEVTNLKSNVSLDLNLEKSRAKDSQAESLMEIAKLMNRIDILTSGHSKDLAGLDNRIDKEIANLLATYERYRNDVIKYAAGAVMTCLTICLGFYRIWK